ncbi:MoaD/ThiS family protein [Pelagicoccus sp. NFK12]|uniref:MoaD/ThiS family protein n=1 Tax=Pelagicoccus enzymogenes TaxID=2773457 RepID=A0A927IIJ9_9BACT|nr:MoaD/ThiS family protein [Pelagicoccus enzymogenes]MBD5780914.1 MoaD/ThiS family protein [Pelagicoccus enzymogenes]MDQ8199952.1 MoaD/ThiS family protein [Pelagicoccus enzymogenes]
MPKVSFTANLRRHVDCPEQVVTASTVAEALEIVFADHPRLKTYVLDEQGTLHRHMAILVNGQAIRERQHFALPVAEDDEIFIMQALSGG